MSSRVIWLIGVLGLAALAWIYGEPLNSPPIRSDGEGYYLYLPAAFIDHDLSLRTVVRRHFAGRDLQPVGVTPVPGSRRFLDKYPIGEAILLAPFFLVAHLATLMSGVAPADGFSVLYQALAALAGLTYGVLGLAVLGRLLSRDFSSAAVAWTIAVIALGTNLFHYATYDAVFSHVFSFFLFACFLDRVRHWYARPSRATALTLAILAGLITLVRPTNSILFVVALLFGVTSLQTLRDRFAWLWSRRGDVMLAGLVYVAVLLPQFAYWHVATGHWLIYSYGGESFNFAHPQIAAVLFSLRKGLFVWSPAVLVGVIGSLWVRRYARPFFVPLVVFLVLNTCVIASWHDWGYGGSFGHRAFVESLALVAFGYASVMQAMLDAGARRLAVVLSICLMAYSTNLMVRYWLHLIPYDWTDWPTFTDAFLRWR